MTEEQGQDEPRTLVKTSVSLPPYLYEWIKDVVESEKKFNSQSSVVIVALAELKGRMEEQNKTETEPAKPHGQSEDDLIFVFLKLLSNHKELIGEFNNLRKVPPTDVENVKKVQFK